jgi:hypothetical protein
MMTEAAGRALLQALFTEAGFAIATDVPFNENGVAVDLDGWDSCARVGYEYIAREVGDERQFNTGTLASLEARMQRDELYLFLIDERDAITPDALEVACRGFLQTLAARKLSRGDSV